MYPTRSHKLACTSTEDGLRLESLDLERRDCTIRVAKTKALISFAVCMICAFVFTYANCLFSHAKARLFVRGWELGDG